MCSRIILVWDGKMLQNETFSKNKQTRFQMLIFFTFQTQKDANSYSPWQCSSRTGPGPKIPGGSKYEKNTN